MPFRNELAERLDGLDADGCVIGQFQPLFVGVAPAIFCVEVKPWHARLTLEAKRRFQRGYQQNRTPRHLAGLIEKHRAIAGQIDMARTLAARCSTWRPWKQRLELGEGYRPPRER
jgi:hypothetical protein